MFSAFYAASRRSGLRFTTDIFEMTLCKKTVRFSDNLKIKGLKSQSTYPHGKLQFFNITWTLYVSKKRKASV